MLRCNLLTNTQHIPGKPIAICYLNVVNDDKNVCHLYTDQLSIIQKGKRNNFNRETILDINTKHKKLLFPIIAGGITSTFFLIAAFNFSINIWISLSLSCLGFISFYLGWQGTSTLSVKTSVKEYDFFLFQISKPLSYFIKFIKEYILQNDSDEFYFYLPYTNEDWGSALEKGKLTINQKTYLYSYQQINMHCIKSFLRIDAKKLNSQIMIDTEHNSLTIAPYLDNSINLSAIEMINLS